MLLEFGRPRGRIALAALLLAAASPRAFAQAPAAKPASPAPAATQATPAPAAAPASDDTVLARVDGVPIKVSDVAEAAATLPEQAKQMPQSVLYPILVDQMVDRLVLLQEARRSGFDKDPAVQHQLAQAADRALLTAYVRETIAKTIPESAIQARYAKDYGGKQGETEVHARHILVESEADAKSIIAELKKGADFATLAKAKSKDSGAAQGGDLGWFKHDDMVPAFADAAFALKPGEYSQTPVKTQFGWHVIKVEEVKQDPPPKLEEVQDQIRQTLFNEALQAAVAKGRGEMKVERFNMDGTPRKDGEATPAAAAAPAPAPAAPPAHK